MKELKLEKPIEMSLVQYVCPNCNKKFYINKDDVDNFTEDTVDCPMCNVTGILDVRLFDVSIQKIFEK